MTTYIYIAIALVAILLLSLWFYIRVRVRRRVDECEVSIAELLSSESTEEAKVRSEEKPTISLHGYIERKFAGRYVRPHEQKAFVDSLMHDYEEINSVYRGKRMFALDSEIIEDFVWQYDSIERTFQEHNERYRQKQLSENHEFFDTVLQYPLDKQQRHSIVSEAENCLVVSSAGSGKTSSIVGKVRYLIDKKQVDPTRILLISYTNKAAAELTERLNTPGLRGYTFHKLAIDMIGQMTKHKPSICENADKIFVDIYKLLLNDIMSPDFRQRVC